jgi:hypothetical protein
MGCCYIADADTIYSTGAFTGLTGGNYIVEIIRHCSNGVDSVAVNSDLVTIPNTYTLSTAVQNNASATGQQLVVECRLNGAVTAAPFTTHISVDYSYRISGGSIITGSQTVTLSAGQTTVIVYTQAGMSVVTSDITNVNPRTSGTITYEYT